MPTINVQYQSIAPPGQSPSQPPPSSAIVLANDGPRVPIAITLHPAILQQLSSQGIVAPSTVTGTALIDTGAGLTCVDIAAATQLNAPIIDYVNMASASHPNTVQPVYPVYLQIPGSFGIGVPRAVGFPLTSHGIVALIGRDVLQFGVLVYNGTAGSISFSI